MTDDRGKYEELSARAARHVGRVLRDKWRLDRLLGVGGMAAVFAATHRNGSLGAVKILHPELSVDPTMRRRFLREGYVANQVGHPGVVKVIDDDEDDGSVFLVMELLEGETIDARWARKGNALPVTEVLSIADQVLEVLAHAHDKGIVHRDVKPDNLFLTTEGQVKILDFGIARMRATSSGHGTQSGHTLGTPAFMAPEHARGRWEEVDTRSDLWAVGATMFTLVTGRFVHGASATVNEQLLAAMTQQAPDLLDVLPAAGEAVAGVIDRALAYDKEDRWRDARAMQHALREAFASIDLEAVDAAVAAAPARDAVQVSRPPAERALTSRPVTTSTSIGPPSWLPRPVRWQWAVGGLAILSAATVVLVLASKGSSAPPPRVAASAQANLSPEVHPTPEPPEPEAVLVEPSRAIQVSDLPREQDESTATASSRTPRVTVQLPGPAPSSSAAPGTARKKDEPKPRPPAAADPLGNQW